MITMEMSLRGFNCFNAYSLNEAREILKKEKIHYILLDINLPDGNGYELINELKNSDERIFVLTGEEDPKFREQTYQKGVIDFIVKDLNFAHKIPQVIMNIEQLEKNKQSTVLIVSESKDVKTYLGKLLKNRFYNIITTENEENVVELVQKHLVDLIIFDQTTESIDAIEFMQNHSYISTKNKISVILLSDSFEASTIRDGMKSGIVEFITQPIVAEELVLKVDLWIDYKRKNDELLCSVRLLQEYKDTVDESSIVSKTDRFGIITYVNKSFCEISGYSEDELIGKNHNILRHPEMPKETFKDMWHTIKKLKKSWRGKVKNRKKDGGFYWVDALIKPIINADGEIEEYIALRHDITEEEEVKKYFKDKLKGSQLDLAHSIKLSQEYENATDKFTAILKTDTDNIITYANDNFCKLSGYSLNELIGINCQSLRDEKHIKEGDCKKLQEILAKGKHKAILFTNIAKDGSAYYLDTIVYPIKNAEGIIKEHLHLMHDITELTNMHKEIEDTQKEIVYKMGEIGESRSQETGYHVKRVAEYSKLLASLYGLSDEEAETIFIVSPMHDIGKVAISDAILKKPGKLTEEEFDIMKSHSEIGYSVLKVSERKLLNAAAVVAHEHHEKWDGGGYPRGLKGEDIHIFGRITAIADVFDALGSDRVYKKAWDDEKIFNLFKEQSGKHFDPVLVKLFLENKEKFIDIRNKYKESI
ncbi:PAS domain S-box protein [Sulfurimonas lithotrophica]|uniref:PAS domain S-box protein n=2 Tax=Sulfurimonas lithotrophica TaxID=2590022 RepID=A0A5P8P3Z6_9BACT|nr:PAS domain S-box protein [Sulfurimonas lithotrophica]